MPRWKPPARPFPTRTSRSSLLTDSETLRARTALQLWESPSPTARSSRRTASGNESIARSIKSILNKLTLEKFQALSQQLLSCGISTAQHVEVLIREIFDKATTQHHFIDMY
ncbi:unnamed protein product, partial [Effrenium voratum]